MNVDRPSPDELLEVVRKEESQEGKGQLKIFLGLAAGVGKTYAMLKEAARIKKDGIDVVIGIVDTHERKETAALLEGLKVVPLKTQVYKDKDFYELDVEAILALQPQVVLVDELAHHNVPGSKHAKRWQDVLEILDHGIDVFTTLNVQHIESLNDIIRTITDINVRETVPDHVIDMAASIQLVDLTPDELLQRLKEGRVYFDEQSKTASLHFFQKEKLTALREIALRYAADKVDRDLRSMSIQKEKMIDWKPREKFLTAISASPHSQKLIRTTRRLATAVDAPWIAAHIDNGHALNESEAEQLSRNFSLARDLGAEVITLSDPSIAAGLKRIAKQRGVTQIIVGRPPSSFFLTFIKGYSLVEQLTAECRDADIHIIREEKNPVNFKRHFSFSLHKKWSDYPKVLAFSLLITLLSWFAFPYVGYRIVGTIFLIGILFMSLFFKTGPVLFSAILFALIWSFFFIPPSNSFEIHANEDIFMLILYILTAITVGVLISRAMEHKEMHEKNDESSRALYEMIHQIALAPSLEVILKFIKERFDRLLHGTFDFAIKNIDGTIKWDEHSLLKNEKERGAALWAFTNGKEAGWSTDTLPSAENLYIPLQSYHEVVGVLIYKPNKQQVLTTEEKNFIYTVCQQLSNYLERSFTREKVFQHDNLVELQKIQKMILDRFSHAFKWPIENALKALQELKKQNVDKPEIRDIEKSIQIFHKNLANITAMAELSEGMLPLKKSENSVKDAIDEFALFATSLLKDHTIKITIEDNLPPIAFDYYLIQVLLNNLLYNAIEYSKDGTPIEIDARKEENFIVISVTDEDKGKDEANNLNKFYSLSTSPLPRTSLGLAMSKTIAELHQGSLKADSLPNNRTRFSLSLPIH